MSSRTRTVILLAFVAALGAGTVMGIGVARLSEAREPRSWLADDLALSAAQREQMREIWSKVAQGGPGMGDRGRAMRKERDDAIAKLIPEDRKGAYEKIIQDHAAAMEAMNRERAKAYQDAVERTKQILTESQRRKYEEILKRQGEHRRGGPHGPGPERPSPTSATSEPRIEGPATLRGTP